MHPSLEVYHHSLKEVIHTDFEIELLNDDCLFSEGPVWNSKGFYLFSDIPNNTIHKLTPGNKKEIYLENSGCNDPQNAEHQQMGSNGLAYDNDGALLICQHGNHAIAKYDGENLAPLITTYKGNPFNSPNDLTVHSNGSIFFSDPPYGLKDQKHNPVKYQPLAAVYCLHHEEIKIVTDKYQYPNGVCLSADEKFLYTCSNKPFETFVMEFDAIDLSFKRIVCRENSDGIKCDDQSNLYLCKKEGIIIINNKGEKSGLIKLSSIPTNICRGGKDLKDLLICARENIFLIRNLLK